MEAPTLKPFVAKVSYPIWERCGGRRSAVLA